MLGFSAIFGAVLPVFLLVGAGWLLRRIGGLTQEGEHNLMRVVVNLLFPALIFSFVFGNPKLKSPGLLLEAGLTGYLMIVFGCLAAYWLAVLLGIHVSEDRRTFSVAGGVHNFGYIAIPVAGVIFPENAAETIGVMLVVNAGIDFAIWSVCVMVLSGGLELKAVRRAINPPIVALISAATLNFIDAETWLPVFFLKSIDMLAPCAIPIGLVMVGTAFYGLTNQLKGPGLYRNAGGTLLLRQALLPLCLLGLAKFIPFNPEVRNVLLVHAAMPAAVFPIVLAKFYGGSPVTAIQCSLPSNLFGFLTIPLWVQAGLWWLG